MLAAHLGRALSTGQDVQNDLGLELGGKLPSLLNRVRLLGILPVCIRFMHLSSSWGALQGGRLGAAAGRDEEGGSRGGLSRGSERQWAKVPQGRRRLG